jgi:hypothetical protein
VRQQDVLRRDVAVQADAVVQHLQRIQQRAQQFLQPTLLRWFFLGLQPVVQRLALVVRHHRIGAAVALPEPQHLLQRGMVERGQPFCIADEVAQAQREGLAMAARTQRDRVVRQAMCPLGRHVFLDRHGAL